jgi:hypothetical protein
VVVVVAAGKGKGDAFDARAVVAGLSEQERTALAEELGAPVSLQGQRDRYADEAEQAVGVIEEKIAGMQATLKTAKVEAKRLRAEADKGGE